ncbi:unnamed protein product [Clavelina lepadiformis]|uniref:Uncharacterized protein n=1 Tax=Clavelina lepadiformis TaxID=159417 RepID=A0ABP0FT71_CLALP
MSAHLTYADRVKRQWNNDIAAEYSNHREVTIQLANKSKRKDIYKLIKETQPPLSYIEGIIQKPGNVVNITIESKKNAIRLADIFRKRPEAKSATAHGDDRTDLTIRWGHKFKECPERKEIPDVVEEKSTQNAETSQPTEEDPSKESPSHDSNELTSEQQKTRGSKRNDMSGDPAVNQEKQITQRKTDEPRQGARSGRGARRSRAKTELSPEENQEPDFDERPSEREEIESRGNKRKNISGDSDEQQQEEPGFMDEQIPQMLPNASKCFLDTNEQMLPRYQLTYHG